jgi:hypothetical protein
MIDPLIYTLDNGLTYQMEFNKTKDHINFEHYKTVKYLTINDLIKLRDNIDKITIKFRNLND